MVARKYKGVRQRYTNITYCFGGPGLTTRPNRNEGIATEESSDVRRTKFYLSILSKFYSITKFYLMLPF